MILSFWFELARNLPLLRNPKWVWRNRLAIRSANRWHSSDPERWLYRGASYCIDCRTPVVVGFLCDSCADKQGVLADEPDREAMARGQAKWNKALEENSS